MKRFFLIFAVVLATATIHAQDEITVITNDGVTTNGAMLKGNDSTLVVRIKESKKQAADTIIFHIADIRRVTLYGEEFVPYQGKLIAEKKLKKQQIDLTHTPVVNQSTSTSTAYQGYRVDPNNVIGKALKSTGDVALGIGIPCAIGGVALLIAGSSGKVSDVNQAYAKANMATVGAILVPVGASLTIVGIPLHIHGKKIMNMNFNYTGNGAGVALQF